MAPKPDEAFVVIQSALEALKHGDRKAAQSLAEQAASLVPETEEPWLILAALASPGQSLAYIKKALQINPESKPAQHALEWALKRQRDRSPAPKTEPPAERRPLRAAPAVPVEPPQLESSPRSIPVTAGPAIPGAISPRPAQPSPPATGREKSSLSRNLILMLSLLGLGVFVIVVLLALWFGGPLLQRLTQVGQALPPTSVITTLIVPTPDCGPPTLVLGSATFQIQTLTPAPDGSLPASPATPDVAYWVEGTSTNYVFVLSSTPDNFALLSNLPAGSTAKATWRDCNSTTYNLLSTEPGSLNGLAFTDQSLEGITVFIPSDAAGNGFLARGELTEEQIRTINTPSGTEMQAEISLLETTASPDGATLRIGVSIQNYGGSPFTLTVNDISLTSSDGMPPILLTSEPSLPKEIKAGATETLYFTYTRPSTPTATLKILGVEYDIEGH